MRPGKKPHRVRPIPVPRAARDLIRRVDPNRVMQPVVPSQRFVMDGEDWLAQVAGAGLGGSDALAVPALVAVRFFRAADPDVPVREALLPPGRLGTLFDEELRALFLSARPIEPPDEQPR
ncbi:MAG TPA: hypothetical protein VF188_03615 [Longimicrobiales bacterium]